MQQINGTASSWARLIEELSKSPAGKFIVVVDGRSPVSVSRITNPFRLTEREDKRE